MAAQSRPDASASRIPTLRNTTLEAEPKCGVDDAFSLEAEPKCGVDDAFSPAQGAAPAPESADERGRAAAR
ncbi:MAG: hypothetical protein KIT32_18080, partial [Rhodocyclaceae bacterium]|nr:hypothetical protein [Rhodocyclaceae bacterium]